jgi:hypothetical protein
MRKTVIIFLILFPFLGNSTKKPIDVDIILPGIGCRGGIHCYSYYFAEGWCNFFQDNKTGEYYLQKAHFTISDPVYDECSNDTTIWVNSDKPNSLFVIKGLKPQKKMVKTLVIPIGEGIKVGEKHSFSFGKITYTFRSEGTFRIGYHDEYWYKIKDYKLYLSDGKNEQLVTTVSEFWGTSPEIVWIGDLDRDGKLDFAVRTATWFEDEKIELYLSSITEKVELVKLAGTASYFRQC